MDREKIIKLVQSTDPGDVTIGLNFLRHYRYRDIKTMFYAVDQTKNTYTIKLSCRLPESGYYKLQHSLYMHLVAYYVIFTPIPKKGYVRYKSFLL